MVASSSNVQGDEAMLPRNGDRVGVGAKLGQWRAGKGSPRIL